MVADLTTAQPRSGESQVRPLASVLDATATEISKNPHTSARRIFAAQQVAMPPIQPAAPRTSTRMSAPPQPSQTRAYSELLYDILMEKAQARLNGQPEEVAYD